ncbi:MAG: YolD-like family protein [Bacillus sp. (in: Bacteria)]|nr:YolD-like family protein [Bacillus sp. (in: firmicutes)]
MNRDRGTIKWTSMMLPEHVQQLKKLAENHKKKQRPQADEQTLEEWSRLLGEAYQYDLPLSITIHIQGQEEIVQGFVHKINPVQRSLTLEHPSDRLQRKSILFEEVIEITVVE